MSDLTCPRCVESMWRVPDELTGGELALYICVKDGCSLRGLLAIKYALGHSGGNRSLVAQIKDKPMGLD